MAVSVENVGTSDDLVSPPDKLLRGPDKLVAVLSRVHSVTFIITRLSDDRHAVFVAALREAVEVVAHRDELLCDPDKSVADAVKCISGASGTSYAGVLSQLGWRTAISRQTIRGRPSYPLYLSARTRATSRGLRFGMARLMLPT